MRRGGWAVVVLLACVTGTARATTYVTDPLVDPSFAGRGSKGGTFGANGWTTTNAPTDASQDSVWYEIPDALTTGSVEFTVTGISIGGTLTGSDHDLIVLYAAPTGEAEPIPYSPSFRNNDFKAFIRIFGSLEPTRPGATKLEVAACPRGDPWWHNDACPAGCDQAGIAYANGGNDPGWDGATPYRMRIEWSPGLMSYYRNGAKLGDVPFTGTYAPQPLRVRIGSPRNDNVYPGEAFMPAGLTFKDVLIEGTSGSATPACNLNPTPDAGAAGATSSDAGGGATTESVLADVTGASWETGVFPDVTDLNVEANADTTPSAVVYLRFPPVTGSVDKAVLRLHTQSSSSAAGESGIRVPRRRRYLAGNHADLGESSAGRHPVRRCFRQRGLRRRGGVGRDLARPRERQRRPGDRVARRGRRALHVERGRRQREGAASPGVDEPGDRHRRRRGREWWGKRRGLVVGRFHVRRQCRQRRFGRVQ